MYHINCKIIHQIVLYKNIRKYKITNEIMLFYIFFFFLLEIIQMAVFITNNSFYD